jgi:hypothetical protein
MAVKRRRWGLYVTDDAVRQAKVMSSERMETIGEYIEGLLKEAWEARGKEVDFTVTPSEPDGQWT